MKIPVQVRDLSNDSSQCPASLLEMSFFHSCFAHIFLLQINCIVSV